MFQQIGLIAKHGDERVTKTVHQLIALLESLSLPPLVGPNLKDTCEEFGLPTATIEELGNQCDLVIVVGGDGTLLGAARSLTRYGVPLLGINLGRLGFLTDFSTDNLDDQLARVLRGEYLEEERFLLHATIVRDGVTVLESEALNDIVVHKWNIARLISLDTYIDGAYLNTLRSDGLIVSTPTGSTAYALSVGGPIMHPALDAIVVVPICPHTLSNRPVVVDAASRVEIVGTNGELANAQLTCDGQAALELSGDDRVVIERAPQPLRLIHPKDHDYYATLRAKLHWAKEL